MNCQRSEEIAITATILLAEDSPADAYLVERRAEQWHEELNLEVLDSGTKAWECLKARLPENPPELMILDINLPGMNGHEVLELLSAESMGVTLPVVVLSTSDDPLDVSKAYSAGALGYVRKPTELEDFEHAIDTIFEYWLRVAENPAHMPPIL